MTFSDKLNFLMNITQTSNKELAAGITVDRSLVSLLRTGKRGMPRNHEHISHMAFFFARRCTADFQRHALAEMLGHTILRSSRPANILADYLDKWLTGDPDLIEHILDEMDNTEKPIERMNSIQEEKSASITVNETDKTTFYYGNEGRRDAMRQMMSIIKNISEPCNILFASDDNLEWMFEDYAFTQEFQVDIIDILQRGFTLYQIMPSVNFLNRYVESLHYWLPLYTTGQVQVFYYPRLRDNLYRHSVTIFPGYCVQHSIGVGLSNNYISLVSTDSALVRENVNQYQEYLSFCKPALTVHDSPDEFVPCFQDFFSRSGSTIQKVFPLSADTLPGEYLIQLAKQATHPAWEKIIQMFLDKLPRFEEQLKTTAFIDIVELSTAEEVRSGKVPLASPFKMFEGHPVYTPETYILHLKNILRLMDEYENYYFVPLPENSRRDYNLFVKEDELALLIRNCAPPMILELRRPEMMQACREHLLRMAERISFDAIQRTKTRMQINALIRELQN